MSFLGGLDLSSPTSSTRHRELCSGLVGQEKIKEMKTREQEEQHRRQVGVKELLSSDLQVQVSKSTTTGA